MLVLNKTNMFYYRTFPLDKLNDNELVLDFQPADLFYDEDCLKPLFEFSKNTISLDKRESIITIEQAKVDLEVKLQEAKAYLDKTDFKMTVDYYATLTKAEQLELSSKRAEARDFIRINSYK